MVLIPFAERNFLFVPFGNVFHKTIKGCGYEILAPIEQAREALFLEKFLNRVGEGLIWIEARNI
jgi:hypothetical protein